MIAEYQFKNNAKGQLASGITDSQTSLSVKAGEGAEFPALSGNQFFMCTLVDTSGNREIIKVTARTGDSFDTIVRAQEGTTGRAFSSDDKVELRVTAGFFDAIVSELTGGFDVDGGELILDADGDSSLHADTNDQLDLKLGGSDIIHFKVAAIEPESDNTVNLGSASKEYKDLRIDGVAYIDEFDIDGTHKASFPTNGVGADAKFMMGLNTTIIWMYLNVAPPGWKVTSIGEDTILGVKATAKSSGTATSDTASKLVDSGATFQTDGVVVGDVAYNLDDGTSALVTAVNSETSLNLASDAFPDGNEQYEVGSKFIDPGGNQADEGSWTIDLSHNHKWYNNVNMSSDGQSWNSGGSVVSVDKTVIGANKHILVDNAGDGLNKDLWTNNVNPSDGLWRPDTSIGRLFQLDTA